MTIFLGQTEDDGFNPTQPILGFGLGWVQTPIVGGVGGPPPESINRCNQSKMSLTCGRRDSPAFFQPSDALLIRSPSRKARHSRRAQLNRLFRPETDWQFLQPPLGLMDRKQTVYFQQHPPRMTRPRLAAMALQFGPLNVSIEIADFRIKNAQANMLF